MVDFSPDELTRYSRHLLLPEIGHRGQQKLKSAHVLVVGAGGLGSPVALYLAAAGVGNLGIIDHDRLDLSNLQRQILYGSANIGGNKAELAVARLAALNPEIHLRAHNLQLQASNAMDLIAQYDLVIDGSDRLATRYLVNDVCVMLRKSLVSAAIHRFEGQAMSYVPLHGPCYRCLFPRAADGDAPNCAEIGVLGVLPGIFGTLQATEALKIILGIGAPLLGRLLTFDALAMRWQEFGFARRADCAVCGDHPSILNIADSVAASRDRATDDIQRLMPDSLRTLLTEVASHGRTPLLIDVREPREFVVGHINAARNIPLASVAQRLTDIQSMHGSAGGPLIFICRSGSRSLAAAILAAKAGLNPVAHLEGGLLAWQAQIDSRIAVANPTTD